MDMRKLNEAVRTVVEATAFKSLKDDQILNFLLRLEDKAASGKMSSGEKKDFDAAKKELKRRGVKENLEERAADEGVPTTVPKPTTKKVEEPKGKGEKVKPRSSEFKPAKPTGKKSPQPQGSGEKVQPKDSEFAVKKPNAKASPKPTANEEKVAPKKMQIKPLNKPTNANAKDPKANKVKVAPKKMQTTPLNKPTGSKIKKPSANVAPKFEHEEWGTGTILEATREENDEEVTFDVLFDHGIETITEAVAVEDKLAEKFEELKEKKGKKYQGEENDDDDSEDDEEEEDDDDKPKKKKKGNGESNSKDEVEVGEDADNTPAGKTIRTKGKGKAPVKEELDSDMVAKAKKELSNSDDDPADFIKKNNVTDKDTIRAINDVASAREKKQANESLSEAVRSILFAR